MFKKTVIFLVLAAVLSSALWIPALARPFVERRLREFCAGAEVSVGKFSFAVPAVVVLSAIDIKSKRYEVSVAKATLDSRLRLVLFSPRIRILEFPSEWFRPGAGAKPPPMRSVELKDLDLVLRLKSMGLEADIRGSAVYDLKTGLSDGRLVSDSFRWNTFSAKDVVLDAAGPYGTLTAAELRAGKLKATAVKGTLTTEPRALRIDPFSADVAGGRAEGEVRVNFEGGLNYKAGLRVQSIDMERLTRDFEMEKKVTAGGTLDGKIDLNGDRTGLLGLSGRLVSGAGGGDLVIQDP